MIQPCEVGRRGLGSQGLADSHGVEVTFAKGESIGQIVPVPHQTFAGARAIEEPLASEPEVMAQMDSWRVEREKRAGQRQANHLLYRKAQDVDGHLVHLVRIPVPPVRSGWKSESAADSPGPGDSGA